MGLCNSPDICQEEMNELFNDLEYVRTYIDDLISNKTFKDQINRLDNKLSKLNQKGFKVINVEKSFFVIN